MKQYLGDGVYLEFDGQDFILTTENSITVTNRIVLDFEVWSAMMMYVERLKEVPQNKQS